MAPTNLELVRTILDAWGRGDFSSAEWAHPELEFTFHGGPSPTSGAGFAGMAESLREFLSAWEGFRVEAEEYRELDERRVLVLVRLRGTGKTSGLDLERIRPTGANLFEVRDGKIGRLVIYWDRERGLAEIGRSSDASSPSSL